MNKLMVKNNSKNERMSKIPSNWNAFRLKDIGYLYSGLSGKSAEDFTDASQFSAPFIPFTNVANNFYLSIGNMRSVIIYPTESQNYVKKNDFFFLMSSEGYEDIGKSSLLIRELSQRTYLNSFCKGFRLNKKNIDARYLNYFLHSVFCRNQIIVEDVYKRQLLGWPQRAGVRKISGCRQPHRHRRNIRWYSVPPASPATRNSTANRLFA